MTRMKHFRKSIHGNRVHVAAYAVVALLTVMSLAAGTLAPTHAQTQGKMQKYDGAAAIGNLDRITVVYPAAEGAAGEVFRDSAELRASYLFERYGVLTDVVADDAITEDQLQGHLLVLGWQNAVLGTPRAPSPFQRHRAGFTFSGRAGFANDDLLFMHPSPYNPTKYLAFWSRIHPEMDRFNPFPFVGSDWVIYRDHLHVRQGMLQDSANWPPVVNENAETEKSFPTPPKGRSSEHYTVLHVGSVASDEQIGEILKARESALKQAAALLETSIPEGFHVNLYLYMDLKHKQRETGVADPVHTFTHRSELYMPRAQARRPIPHEEIHLLAARIYGSCSLAAMYEGLAFASESKTEELAAFAGLMVEHNALPQLDLLLDDEKLRKITKTGQGFPAAGLLMHWVEAVAGKAGVKEAYSFRRGNVIEGLARLSGTTPDTVGKAFQDWVRKLAAGSQRELDYRKALREAHQRGRVGDFTGRAEALTRAISIKDEDPQIHYQLGLAYIEDGQYDRAQQTLRALADRAESLGGSYVVIFSHYQLGRVHQLAGRPEEARGSFNLVLTMPDQHGAHKLAREALAAL